LLELVKRCLSANPADRPRDAGVLAKDVSAHLLSVDDSVRRSQVHQARISGEQAAAKSSGRRALIYLLIRIAIALCMSNIIVLMPAMGVFIGVGVLGCIWFLDFLFGWVGNKLVALVKRCLSANPAERARDAGVFRQQGATKSSRRHALTYLLIGTVIVLCMTNVMLYTYPFSFLVGVAAFIWSLGFGFGWVAGKPD
jgi:Flp pilus assembly protein TadB